MKVQVGILAVLWFAVSQVLAQVQQLHVGCALSSQARYLLQVVNAAPAGPLAVTTTSSCQWEVNFALVIDRADLELIGFRFRLKHATSKPPSVIVNASNVKFTEHVYVSDLPNTELAHSVPVIVVLKPRFSASVSIVNSSSDGIVLYPGATDFDVRCACSDFGTADINSQCVYVNGASHGSIDARAQNTETLGLSGRAVLLFSGAHHVKVKAMGINLAAVVSLMVSSTSDGLHDLKLDGVEGMNCDFVVVNQQLSNVYSERMERSLPSPDRNWLEHLRFGHTPYESEAVHENIEIKNVIARDCEGAIWLAKTSSLLVQNVLIEESREGFGGIQISHSREVSVECVNVGSEQRSGGYGFGVVMVLMSHRVWISRVKVDSTHPSMWYHAVFYSVGPDQYVTNFDFDYVFVNQIHHPNALDVAVRAEVSLPATAVPIFFNITGGLIRDDGL